MEISFIPQCGKSTNYRGIGHSKGEKKGLKCKRAEHSQTIRGVAGVEKSVERRRRGNILLISPCITFLLSYSISNQTRGRQGLSPIN